MENEWKMNGKRPGYKDRGLTAAGLRSPEINNSMAEGSATVAVAFDEAALRNNGSVRNGVPVRVQLFCTRKGYFLQRGRARANVPDAFLPSSCRT